jgi:polar amino acid transport system permease protein
MMLDAMTRDLGMFLPPLLLGVVVTMELTAASFLLAIVIGLIACFCRIAGRPVISKAATAYIEIIRGTPLLLQLFYIYYALPDVGIRLPAFYAGVAGLSVNFGAYLAELFRAGIQSVETGQTQAARSLGMTSGQVMRHVVLPQAFRNIFPALANYALVLVKESSLVAVLSVHELMRAGELLASSTFRTMKVFTLVGLIYLTVSYALSLGFRQYEKRLSIP